jgi:hypothetical protein
MESCVLSIEISLVCRRRTHDEVLQTRQQLRELKVGGASKTKIGALQKATGVWEKPGEFEDKIYKFNPIDDTFHDMMHTCGNVITKLIRNPCHLLFLSY